MKSTQAGRAGGLSLAQCMLQGACPEGAPRLWPHASLIAQLLALASGTDMKYLGGTLLKDTPQTTPPGHAS